MYRSFTYPYGSCICPTKCTMVQYCYVCYDGPKDRNWLISNDHHRDCSFVNSHDLLLFLSRKKWSGCHDRNSVCVYVGHSVLQADLVSVPLNVFVEHIAAYVILYARGGIGLSTVTIIRTVLLTIAKTSGCSYIVKDGQERTSSLFTLYRSRKWRAFRVDISRVCICPCKCTHECLACRDSRCLQHHRECPVYNAQDLTEFMRRMKNLNIWFICIIRVIAYRVGHRYGPCICPCVCSSDAFSTCMACLVKFKHRHQGYTGKFYQHHCKCRFFNSNAQMAFLYQMDDIVINEIHSTKFSRLKIQWCWETTRPFRV